VADEEDLNLEDLGGTADTTSDVAVNEAPATTEMTEQPAQEDTELARTAADLEAVFDIPVNVTAVLGKSRMQVSKLLKLGRGAVVELDRKVGEAIDIYVNNRLVARGEVVVVEDRLGVTMTEIIKSDRR
jgi:flagellar motor switch protein FliN